jgi:hypothetical protein
MFYNNDTLDKYCNDNNIILLDNYSQIKVNRDHYIKGKCIKENCNNEFHKTFRQLINVGGYCHECSVENGKQKYKQKCKYNKDYLQLFCHENTIILHQDYSNKNINRDTIIHGKCINSYCENNFTRIFRELIKLNGYCFDCCKELGKQKIVNTNLRKYGEDNPMKVTKFKEKLKETLKNLYGVEHISQLEEIKKQIIATNLEKYGTEYVLQSEIVKNKSKETNLLKYGVDNPQKNKDIREKTENTNTAKYGVNCYFKTETFKQKYIEKSLEKYGVSHHSQNSEVAENMLKNSYNIKKYTLPSGKIINYQGYENFAFDELLHNENICEDDIITSRKDVPEIWYTDKSDKKRRHYVDIYIKSQNRCIEVKSTWTNQSKNNVLEKQQTAINLGYKYEIWIFDKHGNKL